VEIYLNGEKLDFALESERTVADVAAALGGWLATGSLCVPAVAVDSVDAPPSRWEAIAVSGARRLDVSVSSRAEARVQTLRTAAEFLGLLRKAVSGPDRALLRDLAAGYPAMVEGIRSILCPLPGNELHAQLLALDQLLSGNTPERIAEWPADTAATALRALDGLVGSVTLALEESDQPLQALPRVRAGLLASLSEIDRVPVLLQTGKDGEAMARIVALSEHTQGLLRIISLGAPEGRAAFRVDGRPLEEFQRELNLILRQLLDAFGARDTVLIGDLLEYEAAPRLRALGLAAESLEPGATA
jgi:hypothetical protein